MANRWETMEIVTDFISLGSKITADSDCSHEIKTLALCKKSYDKPRLCNKKQRHYFADKGPHSQSYGFSSSHVWMWELDYKESWALKNWCFWTVVLEKLLRVLWKARRSNQSILKEINLEYSLEGLVLRLKFQYFGHLMQRAHSLEKTLTLRKMIGWHHRFNGHDSEQALGNGERQGSLACCSPWALKESDSTEPLNNS